MLNRGGASSGKDLVVSAEIKGNEKQLSQQAPTPQPNQIHQLTENHVRIKENGEVPMLNNRKVRLPWEQLEPASPFH